MPAYRTPGRCRAATLAEKAARAAGEGAAYAIAPQAQSRSFGRNVISGLVQQTALGNADPLRVLTAGGGGGSIGMSAPKPCWGRAALPVSGSIRNASCSIQTSATSIRRLDDPRCRMHWI